MHIKYITKNLRNVSAVTANELFLFCYGYAIQLVSNCWVSSAVFIWQYRCQLTSVVALSPVHSWRGQMSGNLRNHRKRQSQEKAEGDKLECPSPGVYIKTKKNKFTAATIRITKQIYALNCIVDNRFLHMCRDLTLLSFRLSLCHKNITTLLCVYTTV